MTRSLASSPRPFPETAALAGPPVRSAARSLDESRAAAQRIASKYPPVLEGHVLSPTQEAILRVLPSSVGVPMTTAGVVLALRSGKHAIELTLAASALALVGLWDLGLVRAVARPFEEPEDMRWTRTADGEAVRIVVAATDGDAIDRALGNGGHP